MKSKTIIHLVVFGALAQFQPAVAAVSADEAAQLKSALTPLGGERAGNKDGSIPAWNGTVTKAAGARVGDIPVSLFPGEKPVVQISAANMAQYADKLSEGTAALLEKYPESFRVNVFPTHRTAVAPQHVYDATARNATACRTVEAGLSVEGCFGGVPFPIPKSGVEVIWNYILRIEPESVEFGSKNIVGTSNGARAMATRTDNFFQHPYYYKDGSAQDWSGEYFLQRFNTTAPPFKAGESLVLRDSINAKVPRQAWQYLVGQRRVRRAPTVAYDTPDFVSSGANYFDEVMGFMGHPDRFEWKLVGKREMYIPYNNNELVTAKEAEAFDRFHLNADKLRWELHRVWEVEASVVSGKRHAVPKRRYYFDEDTWLLTLVDGYDSEGKLWRTSVVPNFFVPAVPAVLAKPVTIYNLQAGTMSTVQGLFQDETYRVVARKNESFFTGDAAAADADR
ncbi:DUF1329 domain-containing protein [Parazoarcus communis]|uniref:DUF1329 domain-containing protein n=1 Tax=Parazoarcus communis SWub3 = DSM 12120 TaxID=1121029 RepID=A0A323UZA8_9RHOO|nr:DUF1329 domain-containing protein [Parazoarcus communis]NMG68695.1 DUF1329 domain-containing protein [Parazoarcus communis SWub3 = DSM 12120]PZA17825.1 DUF1329 domain-containing protein [Azoarcus communis] [Parazoarcus communis SWub3 = DSM 12120]